jgi:branched-chain amino acid transport system ATP-binding protein
MLDLSGVNAFYGSIRALRDVSISVGEGEVVTLIGANGAGKSTTLMAICGVVPVASGSIRFDGREMAGMSPDKVASLGIRQVPEGRRIFPNLTVAENLAMGSYLRRDKEGIREDEELVYGLFPILRERRSQNGGTLSGGEQQMLAISRALMARPRLLLLDEPSLGLAPIIVRQIFEIIKRINEGGTTIFLVEQNANLALRVAGRGYVMENGAITMVDTAGNLMRDEAVKKAYLGL